MRMKLISNVLSIILAIVTLLAFLPISADADITP